VLIEQWAERLGPCRNPETLHGPGAVVIKNYLFASRPTPVPPEVVSVASGTGVMEYRHFAPRVDLDRGVRATEAVMAEGPPPRV
jgi:hypothetical protein